MKVFLDTNILLDFYQVRDEFYRPAAIIMDLGLRGELDLFTSSLSIVNAHYVLRKYYAKADLNLKLRSMITVCNVTVITKDDLKAAVDLDWPDFEDCTQYLSALSVNADYIITRNVNDFANSDEISVITPIDFIQMFRKTGN